MGLPDYFKTQRLPYKYSIHTPEYKLNFMLLIPTAMVNASLDRLNKLKGTNAHLIDEFKIKDEFKGVLLGKVHYIVKDIERIIRKDSGVTKFTFMTSKIDDVVFNTKGMNTEVTFYISGVCTDG